MFNQKRLTPALPMLLMATLFSAAALAEQLPDDPMRPPTKASSVATGAVGKVAKKTTTNGNGFHLSAIRITRDKHSATINGKRVGVGGRIASARVLSIQASSVTLQKNGKTLILNLLPLSIKKPVEATQP